MLDYFVLAADYAQLKNDFVASRESLPAMFIATPNDKTVSVWTKEAPSVQVCRFFTFIFIVLFKCALF